MRPWIGRLEEAPRQVPAATAWETEKRFRDEKHVDLEIAYTSDENSAREHKKYHQFCTETPKQSNNLFRNIRISKNMFRNTLSLFEF